MSTIVHDMNMEYYGRNLLATSDVVSTRVTGVLPRYDITGFTHETLRTIFVDISTFCINDVTYCVHRDVYGAGYFEDWHMDDAIKTNLDHRDDDSVTPRQVPIFSMFIFEDTDGFEFEGGSIEFMDGTVVEPIPGTYIMFDSREVYRENRVTLGEQNRLFIRFYE